MVEIPVGREQVEELGGGGCGHDPLVRFEPVDRCRDAPVAVVRVGQSHVGHVDGSLSSVVSQFGDPVAERVDEVRPQSAGFDGAVLGGVADRDHPGPGRTDGLDERVMIPVGKGRGFVDDQHRCGGEGLSADAEFGEERRNSPRWDAGGFFEDFGGGAGHGRAEGPVAGLFPDSGGDVEGGGFAGAGWSDDGLELVAAGRDGGNHSRLVGTEGVPGAGFPFGDGGGNQSHVGWWRGVEPIGIRRDHGSFDVEDGRGCVPVGFTGPGDLRRGHVHTDDSLGGEVGVGDPVDVIEREAGSVPVDAVPLDDRLDDVLAGEHSVRLRDTDRRVQPHDYGVRVFGGEVCGLVAVVE